MKQTHKVRKIPCNKALDNSLSILMEGYPFIQNRCFRHKSDIFQTRILGQRTICMSGPESARLFYNNAYFSRKNAAPKRIQKTLFGQGGIQGLDGKAHHLRKQMFLSIMTPENMDQLVHYTKGQWEYNSIRWQGKSIVLFDEVQIIMCQIACRWAHVPLDYSEINQRAKDLGKMVDGFGGIGPRYWQGKCARKRSENWMKSIIHQIRSHRFTPQKGSAADIICWFRDDQNNLLSAQIAAVELLNIIRPIVAIATYITFGALAFHEFPECRKNYQQNSSYHELFVQEVRRYYPFTPYLAARVKKNFVWNHYFFRKGILVLLDIYGINHDSRLWNKPYEFIPERFLNHPNKGFVFIPQGGGPIQTGHRCAGELVTIEVMKVSFDYMINHMEYKVPKQNLNYHLCRIPSLPKSRFKIKHINRIVD
jgi:Cytochrome P450